MPYIAARLLGQTQPLPSMNQKKYNYTDRWYLFLIIKQVITISNIANHESISLHTINLPASFKH